MGFQAGHIMVTHLELGVLTIERYLVQKISCTTDGNCKVGSDKSKRTAVDQNKRRGRERERFSSQQVCLGCNSSSRMQEMKETMPG